LDEQRRVPEKLLTSWRKRGASFVSDKQGSPELLLQESYSRAHGSLANIEPLRSPNEAARCDNLEEGFGELDIHGSI
jgi:hypothetical protein